MRRKDREITEFTQMEDIIKTCTICHIGFCDGEMPYVVPFNYGYADRCVYLHCANEGKKLDILQRNANVCFEVERDVSVDLGDHGAGCSTYYQSVIAFGRAEILAGDREKREALVILMAQHGATISPESLPSKTVERTTVIKIRLDTMTGKRQER